MADDDDTYVRHTFYVLTSRAAARQAELEADGWIFVSSTVIDDPAHPAPIGQTMTALVMKKSAA